MARIQTYDNDVDIDDADRLVGTDGTIGPNLNKTKNFTLGNIKSYVRSGGANYKVFTALLTQNGETNQQELSSGDLTIGITYYIAHPVEDFSNVGAPNNNIGTYFVAIGTTPNSWGGGNVYYDTGAPVANVLENTIGNVWFAYAEPGSYIMYSDGLFTVSKTWYPINSRVSNFPDESIWLNLQLGEGGNKLYFNVTDGAGSSSFDNGLTNAPIEIRVYN